MHMALAIASVEGCGDVNGDGIKSDNKDGVGVEVKGLCHG